MSALNFIYPDWPAPAHVKACTTTRVGGYSQAPYASFNLGTHVADTLDDVTRNRALLQQALQLPNAPLWLQQVHGVEVIDADLPIKHLEADAAITRRARTVLASMTADCLPLLVTDVKGKCAAAIHAGWRGLASGVIEATLNKLAVPMIELLVWLGPAIGPDAFEVGDDVYQQFIVHNAQAAQAFQKIAAEKWLMNIYSLARQRLQRLGVQQIYGGDFCTYSDATRFYSYRRDHTTGRMVSLIWLTT